MAGPTATVTVPAIDSLPSTRPGGSLSPAHMARRRMITLAAGCPAEVPIPISTRATTATGMVCATPPMVPPRSTTRMPASSTRRGPNSSASLPAAGCATALARYSADTRIAVCPTGTVSACAIGTSAVAIIELLIGLSVAATYSGLTKRHENASSCRSTPDVVALQAGSVLVGNVIDLRSLLADPGRVLPDTRRGGPARTRSARATSLSVLSWHWDVFVRLAGHAHQPTTRKGKHCNAVHGSEPVPCGAPRRPECS